MNEISQRKPRCPRWSVRTTLAASAAIIAIVTTMTLLISTRPLWIELETVTALLSIVAFMFFGHVLYRGVRFGKHERFDFSFRTVGCGDMWGGGGDVLTNFIAFDIESGCLGFIVSIVASILIMALLTVVLWLGLNVAINAVVLVSVPLFYFFKRSLRQLVALGRTCHGRLGRSCLIALRMTVLYIAWFYAIIYLAHRLHFALHPN